MWSGVGILLCDEVILPDLLLDDVISRKYLIENSTYVLGFFISDL